MTDSSVYAFVEDFRAAGVESLLDEVTELGVDGVTVAAAYHQARDLTPRGPARVTTRRDGVHFLPSQRFTAESPLQPPIQDGADAAPLAAIRDATAARGLAMHAWVVALHNSTLGERHPECVSETCFGDRLVADLCPANPDVRRYAVALARDAAALGADSVVAESLHFGSFGHGHHHERCFVDLGALDEFLLGVCFCRHCRARADAAGVPGDEARAACAAVLDRVLSGDRPPGPDEVTHDSVREYAGSTVADYVTGRSETVSSLVAECAAAVREQGSRLVVLDLTGTAKGYATGLPTGAPAAVDAWQFGVDVAAVGEHAAVGVLAYAQDPARVAEDVAAYRRATGADLRVLLRPGRPDTRSAAQLRSKVRAAVASGATAIDFYHYGLVTQPVLGRIAAAREWS